MTFCLSPGDKQFVCPPGDKHFLHTGEGGTNISHTQERGGQTFVLLGRGQTFYVGGGGAYDDVVEDLVVSEANFLVSKASKLSAGARIFRGP